MAQWFRTHTALAEDTNWVPSLHARQLQGICPLFWPPPGRACTHKYRHTHRHIIKNKIIYGALLITCSLKAIICVLSVLACVVLIPHPPPPHFSVFPLSVGLNPFETNPSGLATVPPGLAGALQLLLMFPGVEQARLPRGSLVSFLPRSRSRVV